MKWTTRVRRWHWGKIVILWAWGGFIAALLLARFLSSPATNSPALSAVALLSSIVILIALSVATWIWLGGKEIAA